jgi:hypothetical protein
VCELRDLINLGVDVNVVDRRGRTVFHMLCDTCTVPYSCVEFEKRSRSMLSQKVNGSDPNEAIKFLVESGCDVTLRDNDGMTGWDLALRHKECLDKIKCRNLCSGWKDHQCLIHVLEELALVKPYHSGLCEEYIECTLRMATTERRFNTSYVNKYTIHMMVLIYNHVTLIEHV